MENQQPQKSPCLTGGCLCESIRYQVHSELRQVVACHCRQCQKTSGFHVAATSVAKEKLVLLNSEHLTWYTSSTTAKRGFCSCCGSNLFWQQNNSENTVVFAGTLDQPTGLKLVEHIFVEDKGDYYELNDELPKHSGFERSICVNRR